MQNLFNFKVSTKNTYTQARAGVISTPHGIIETPAFVAVGTRASVRSLTPDDLKEVGVQILFGNTYHLHLRPGEDTIQKIGGLGTFMGWDGPTMTDSGGFQVFSLGKKVFAGPALSVSSRGPVSRFPSTPVKQASSSLRSSAPPVQALPATFDVVGSPSTTATPRLDEEKPTLVKITDDGVTFRSHHDGSPHLFTPEESIKIQKKLGADIILAFDECVPYPSTREYAREAMERTHWWAKRSLAEFKTNPSQALYGIVQGGVYKDLRKESARFIASLPFDGIAIGGVSVGESKKQMRDVLKWVAPFLPNEKPRHLLGMGEIDDIFDAVENGIDTFDCVIPTRFGRYGILFVMKEESEAKGRFRIDINKSIYAKDKRPIAKDCACFACQDFTRAYLHHLFREKELLAYRLASYHNLYFINHLVKEIRKSIQAGAFQALKKSWL